MGTESVPKMGTESVPKMGTESVPKMGTPSHNASGLAFWPPAQSSELPGLNSLGTDSVLIFGTDSVPILGPILKSFLAPWFRGVSFCAAILASCYPSFWASDSRGKLSGRRLNSKDE